MGGSVDVLVPLELALPWAGRMLSCQTDIENPLEFSQDSSQTQDAQKPSLRCLRQEVTLEKRSDAPCNLSGLHCLTLRNAGGRGQSWAGQMP